MQNESIETISARDLDAVFERARSERWEHVAFISPDYPLSADRRDWPEHWRDAKLFRFDGRLDIAKQYLNGLSHLRALTVWGLGIDDAGAAAIAASLTALTNLDLGANGIGPEGAAAIAGSLTALTNLDLRDNNIGDEGAAAIAGSLTALTNLDLGYNKIGPEGAAAIARSLTALTNLDLGFNEIGPEGAEPCRVCRRLQLPNRMEPS